VELERALGMIGARDRVAAKDERAMQADVAELGGGLGASIADGDAHRSYACGASCVS
jgi:hypothetical protein